MRPELEKLLSKAKITPSSFIEEVQRLPTGSLMLDFALGGGWARGRFNVLWGMDNTGKTTLSLLTCAAAQRLGEDAWVMYIDTENKFDVRWSQALGVDIERLAYYQPKTGEEAGNTVLKALELSPAPQVIVLDSLAAMPWVAEAEGTMDDTTMGVAARKLAQFCRLTVPELAKTQIALLLVNQATQIIGAGRYEYPLKAKGGMHVAHAASIRVEMRRIKKLVDSNNVPVGMALSAHIEKNQTADNHPPKSAEINLLLRPPRVDRLFELVTLGKELNLFLDEDGEPITGARKWYFAGQPVGTGVKQVMAVLEQDADLRMRLMQAIQEAGGVPCVLDTYKTP